MEAELNNIYGENNNAVDKQDRKVKIERLIVKCEDAFSRVVDKNEELFDLAQKTEDPDAAFKNLEKWLETVKKKIDEFIAAARGYINSVHDKETAELHTSHHSRSGSHMTSSKRSSQRQRDLELSKLKREGLEKQHEAKLRIARQRLEIEKQTKFPELEIEQLEEDNRKEVAAAALEEIELMTKSSADGSGTGKMSGLFTESQSRARNLFKNGLIRHRPGTWLTLQTNRFCTFWFHRPIKPSNFPTTFFSSTSKLTLQSQYTWSS